MIDSKLFSIDDKIVLAVSGGVDSMVMLDIFVKQYPKEQLAVAHCNFSLRGEESNRDMRLVQDVVKKLDITFYHVTFDTYKEIEKRGKTLQETARELRYEWFDEISNKHGFTKIATAHNTNDTVETFFVNCVRGTGVRGLTGIPQINGKIVRPMLSVTRNDIVHYAEVNKIEYCEDSSNIITKYLRNAIRHDILPHFIKKNGEFISVMLQNIERVKESVDFLDYMVESLSTKIIKTDDDRAIIDISEIAKHPFKEYIIYEILHKFGFSRILSNSIIKSLENGATGKGFLSKTHKAFINRGQIEIIELREPIEPITLFKTDLECSLWSGKLIFEVVSNSFEMDFKRGDDYAFFDYDKLSNSLTVRTWQEGDIIYPFGMNHKKFISDLLIDKKVSISQKHSLPILCNDDDTLWVIPLRSDNRYRVTATTKRVLICHYVKTIV